MHSDRMQLICYHSIMIIIIVIIIVVVIFIIITLQRFSEANPIRGVARWSNT